MRGEGPCPDHGGKACRWRALHAHPHGCTEGKGPGEKMGDAAGERRTYQRLQTPACGAGLSSLVHTHCPNAGLNIKRAEEARLSGVLILLVRKPRGASGQYPRSPYIWYPGNCTAIAKMKGSVPHHVVTCSVPLPWLYDTESTCWGPGPGLSGGTQQDPAAKRRS